LFALLLGDLEDIAPNYVGQLRERLSKGIAVGEGYLELDPSSDGPAEIPDPYAGEPTTMDLSEALLLEEQLFPGRERHDPRDFQLVTRGMAVVAFHSALENLAEAIGATKARTPLPLAIRQFLAMKGKELELPSSLQDKLTEFDETRHLVVHHAGVVTTRYVHNVKYSTMEVGELHSLSDSSVSHYADTAWKAASALRIASGIPPL
jgi:hypothetical protein